MGQSKTKGSSSGGAHPLIVLIAALQLGDAAEQLGAWANQRDLHILELRERPVHTHEGADA